MMEPVLSAVLLNDAEELKGWSRNNFGKDFFELFRVCKQCGRPFGFHCKDGDRCPTLKYNFRISSPAREDEFEKEQNFILDKEATVILIGYLALIGVKF